MIRPTTYLMYQDPERVAPTPDEVREALRLAHLNHTSAAKLLGVKRRTVHNWTGGKNAVKYSAWILLMLYINRVRIFNGVLTPID